MIEEIEWLRKQTADRRALGGALTATVDVAAGEYDSALMELEARFFELRLTGGERRPGHPALAAAAPRQAEQPARLRRRQRPPSHRPAPRSAGALRTGTGGNAGDARSAHRDELDAFNEQLSGAGLPPVVPTGSGVER